MRSVQRFESINERTPRLARVIVGALGLVAWSQAAIAASCLLDRSGEPLNCTANDVRITDLHDIHVTDNGCKSADDTVTFNAVLTVVTTAETRYDIGLFIGTDGEQALTGECRVESLPLSPAPFLDRDHDGCGDSSSAGVIELPVENITVQCVDSDGDNQLDVAFCSS